MVWCMADDPLGYYAALELDRTASPAAITAAFRRKARVLHPDVASTGNAEAFVRIRAAYDVLSDAARRAAYDGTAVLAPLTAPIAEPVSRGPRLSDLPVAAWAGLGGLLCLTLIMAVVQFIRPSPSPPVPLPRPVVTASGSAIKPPQAAPPAVAATSGPTTHYVLPINGDAVLWRRDATRDAFMPGGHVPAFTPVYALRLVPQHGLVEIALTDGGSGFIEATRLAPGDRAEARQADCAYNAGAPPSNGEVLVRHGDGVAQIEINNRADQPAVVKLRDASGQSVATVYLTPGHDAVVKGLPNVAYRPDFATGEVWSRACNAFAAGMRAQRFGGYASPAGLSPLVIPPDLSAFPTPVDIPNEAFEREQD
jgi:hypothetical protein